MRLKDVPANLRNPDLPADPAGWKGLSFAELQAKIHEWAVSKGFFDCEPCDGTGHSGEPGRVCRRCEGKGYDEDKNVPEMLMLKTSELSEALEHYRDGNHGHALNAYYEVEKDGEMKPDGFAVEIADCVIRCFDTAGHMGIDLHEVIARKMAYNRTRKFKHGKKC